MKSALRMTRQNTNLQINENNQTSNSKTGLNGVLGNGDDTNGSAITTIKYFPMVRIRIGLTLTLIGFMMFLLGARPGLFGLDRSPVIGFVQIAVFLVGLGIICIGGYISLMALWKNDPPSIAADFGLRFVATGYVVSVFAGMADVFGFGSHPLPGVPYFGIWQARGVLFGELIIASGFILLIPYRYIFPAKMTVGEKLESNTAVTDDTGDKPEDNSSGE